uniref:Bis(5'-adenosyl)-triphosphatase enpp4-like n=1 Tax=Hirondellea gigas TaxID=1518452 RepID=A0A6A7G7H3_9CRUS
MMYSFRSNYTTVLCTMLFVQFVCIYLIGLSSASDQYDTRSVLVISLDGYGHDYLSKYPSSNILKMLHSGSHPGRLSNQYPTKTFPNHFSMATGLFVESHGVVGNKFYDIDLDETLRNSDNRFFQQNKDVEPIWIVNEKAGGVSACFMWPGCGFNYQNISESYYLPYNQQYSLRMLIDTAITLLDPNPQNTNQDHNHDDEYVPAYTSGESAVNTTNGTSNVPNAYESLIKKPGETRVPSLLMVYYGALDIVGHKFSPNSPEIEAAIHQVDAELGHLMNELERHQLMDRVDVILMSDNGMTEVVPHHVIDLSKIIDASWYSVTGSSPLLHIFPSRGKSMKVYEDLKSASLRFPFSTIIKEDLPDNLHYKANVRVAPLLLQADPGYVFADFRRMMAMRESEGINVTRPYGHHGYDLAECPEMEPIMIAVGPSFKENWRVPPASNVDLFPLLCSLLGLPEPPNNGSSQTLELMMTTPPILKKINRYLITLAAIVMAAVVVGGVATALYCWRQPSHRHSRVPTDPQDLISGYTYRAHMNNTPGLASAIMLSDDELSEEEKLLTNTEVWEV